MTKDLRSVKKHKKTVKTPFFDLPLALAVLGLVIFGVMMIYDASVVLAYEQFHDRLFFFKNQLLWAGVGIVLALLFSSIDYHLLEKFATLSYFLSFVLLLLVLIPGIGSEIYGAKRWLATPSFIPIPIIGRLSLQPSELGKLALVIFLASWLSKLSSSPKKRKTQTLSSSTLFSFFFYTGILAGLVILQPDMGTTIIYITVALIVYFVSGVHLLEFFFLGILSVLVGIFFIFTSKYRLDRFLSFLDPSRDKLGISYHINQILIALGSGGIWGLGLGVSRQKYRYLPEVTTDSIFAIIGEELGFVGCILTVLGLFFVVWRGLKIAKEAPDSLGKLLASGITSLIGIQTTVNLASMVALSPLTGVPLPFISLGGSSLTIILIGVGIMLNISKQREQS